MKKKVFRGRNALQVNKKTSKTITINSTKKDDTQDKAKQTKRNTAKKKEKKENDN